MRTRPPIKTAQTEYPRFLKRGFRIPEAVHYSGMGRSKLYELIAAGRLTTVKIGGCRVVLKESLDALLSA